MLKKIILIIPFLFCFISCDGFSTGGNPNEGKCSFVVKEHGKMANGIRIICPFDSVCDVKFSFGIVGGYGCSAGFEYKFKQDDEIKLVKKNYDYAEPSQNTSVDLNLDSSGFIHFSLIDVNDVEKKYDIDLSGIVNSYMVRGDSVEVNVMKNCSLWLFYCKKDQVYGNNLSDGKYTFLKTEGCDKEYSYDCSWHNQGSFETDDLDIHAEIYWK